MSLLFGAARSRRIICVAILTVCMVVVGVASISVYQDATADSWHPNAERTYRVLLAPERANVKTFQANGPRTLGETVRAAAYPAADASSLVYRLTSARAADASPPEQVVALYAEPELMRLLDLGVRSQALRQADLSRSLLVSDAAGRRLGWRAGQTVLLGNTEYVVLEIISQGRTNSHLRFDVLAPLASLESQTRAGMSEQITFVPDLDATTYVQTSDPISLSRVIASSLMKLTGIPYDVELQPLRSVYRSEPIGRDNKNASLVQGRARDLSAGLFIVVAGAAAALFSITSLLMSSLEAQARTVGVLYSVGRSKVDVVCRALREALWLMLVSFLVAAVLFASLSPAVLSALSKGVGFASALAYFVLSSAALVVGVLASLAGLSWRLASRPTFDLLNRSSRRSLFLSFAGTAIAVQSALCFFVVYTSTLMDISLRETTADTRPISDRWRLTVLDPVQAAGARAGAARSALVDHAVLTNWAPYSPGGNSYPVQMSGYGSGAYTQVRHLVSDASPVPVFGQTVLAGSEPLAVGQGGCAALVNEAFVRDQGIERPALAVGARFAMFTEFGDRECSIVGVVADQNLDGAEGPTGPTVQTVQRPGELGFQPLYLMLDAPDAKSARELLSAVGSPRPLHFPQRISDLERDAFAAEHRLLTALRINLLLIVGVMIATLFSGLALTISQRSTEIGVRRTMGHAWWEVALALARPFFVAIGLSLVIAVPLSIWLAPSFLGVGSGAQWLALPTTLLSCVVVAIPPIAALAFNWAALTKVSPAEVLR